MVSIPMVFVIVAFVLLLIDLVVTQGGAARSRGWWITMLIVLALLWPLVR